MHRAPLRARCRLPRSAKLCESVPTDSRARLRRASSASAFGTERRRRARDFRFRFRVSGPLRSAFGDATRRRASLVLRARASSCSRSLTACGLALPPDDFITWPTNQPIAFGFALASATLSGLLAMMSSTTFSIAPRSVTCFMPRASTIARGSPPSAQTISNRSLAILPEIVPSAIRSRMAPSCAAETGDAAMSRAFLVEPAEQLVDHPVGGELRSRRARAPPPANGLEIVRGLALGDQHAGVVSATARSRA